MKLLITIIAIACSISAYSGTDSLADNVHEWVVSEDFKQGELQFNLVENTPESIQLFLDGSFKELVGFAQSNDLFQYGFSYTLHQNVYQVVDANGDIIAYTYSINILKNKVETFRRFYILAKRVDGEFFVADIVTFENKSQTVVR